MSCGCANNRQPEENIWCGARIVSRSSVIGVKNGYSNDLNLALKTKTLVLGLSKAASFQSLVT